ncbi:MAG: hypothetical protein M1825_006105 [Sarcosagium campestre]|nr:MAG: hypothetical protein M1825_006105 [Sarcosagium campestre]
MDSPIVSQLFRHLSRHPLCRSRSNSNRLTRQLAGLPRCTQRTVVSGSAADDARRRESNWQQRTDLFAADKTDEYKRYPMLTASQLRTRKDRPRRVKMLTRDFIEDSLYNPSYGYFSKQAVIFSPGTPFDFPSMRDEAEFQKQLDRRYQEFEDVLDARQYDATRQLWHTPTEIFRPHYGEAIARYLVSNYKLSLYPYHDLIIYEMGAGNGTLMLNILDYIRDTDPDVYARTQFKIIEISPALADLQQSNLRRTANTRGHSDRVSIINESIFDWKTYVPSPCFFLALEVFDNFAHDSIRYDPFSEDPLQGQVLIDAHGDFHEFYTRDMDPDARRFLEVRRRATAGAAKSYPHPLGSSRLLRRLRARLPVAANLTPPEYIPTRMLQFFDVLHASFPAHRLIMSDFHALPNAVPGSNAPVVQTRYKRHVVPVTTPFVHQGYFDIFFPVHFPTMELMYRAVTGKLTRVLTHEDFLRRWAYVHDTQTRSGENPMLSWYQNASVMTTL